MISSAKSSFIAAFADELKRAREYSGISMDEVFARTHVSRAYLEALEAGQWEGIPQPYLRGYLSLYAQAVGMNLDKVLKSFDQLMSAPDDADPATLDMTSPLLRQPEHIGVTRAKIRTGWFTAITQNRKTAHLVLLASIGLLATGLYLSRRAQRPQFTVRPFQSTIEEYGQSVRGPLTHVFTFAQDSGARLSRADTLQVRVIARHRGSAVLWPNDHRNDIIRYQAYDTIVIHYDTITYIAISPATSASLAIKGRDSLRPQATDQDTAYYVLAEEYLVQAPVRQDTAEAH